MKFGIFLSGDHITLEETVQFARQAEAQGFDSVWVGEFWREAFVPLTAMALQTNRIRLGTAIALTRARNPIVMELAAAAVDEFAHGRFVLGIGPGAPIWNHEWLGLQSAPAAAYLREYAEVLRLMWTAHSGRTVSYTGTYLKIQDYQRATVPYREQIPIYFGAVVPRSLRATGAVADGLCTGALPSVRYLTEVVQPQLAEGQRAGQRTELVEISAMVICAVAADGHTARERAKGQVAFYVSLPYYDAVLDLHGFAEEKTRIREARARGDVAGMIAGVSNRLLETVAVAGTAEECRAAVERYQGMADEVMLYPPSFGLSREEVLANHAALLQAFGR